MRAGRRSLVGAIGTLALAAGFLGAAPPGAVGASRPTLPWSSTRSTASNSGATSATSSSCYNPRARPSVGLAAWCGPVQHQHAARGWPATYITGSRACPTVLGQPTAPGSRGGTFDRPTGSSNAIPADMSGSAARSPCSERPAYDADVADDGTCTGLPTRRPRRAGRRRPPAARDGTAAASPRRSGHRDATTGTRRTRGRTTPRAPSHRLELLAPQGPRSRTAPTVTATTPVDGATASPSSANLTVTFSEPVTARRRLQPDLRRHRPGALRERGSASSYTLDPTPTCRPTLRAP